MSHFHYASHPSPEDPSEMPHDHLQRWVDTDDVDAPLLSDNQSSDIHIDTTVDQAPPPPQEELHDDDMLFEEMEDDGSVAPVCSIQAVASIFERGNAQEVIMMLPELVTLARACPDGLQGCIIPMLCLKLPQWGPDLQLATGEHILQCIFSSNEALAKAIALCAIQVSVSSLSSDNLSSTTLMPQLLATYGDILLHSLSASTWSHTYCIKILALVDHFATTASNVGEGAQQAQYQCGHKLLAVKILRGLCASNNIPHPLLTSALLPRLWTLLLSDRSRPTKQHDEPSHQSNQSLQQRFASFGSNVLSNSFQLSHSVATASSAPSSAPVTNAATHQVPSNMLSSMLSTTAGMEDTDEEILVKAHLVCALCGLSEHFSSRKLLDKLWPAILSVWNDDKDGYGRAIILPCVACMLNTSMENCQKTNKQNNTRQTSKTESLIHNSSAGNTSTTSIAEILVGSSSSSYTSKSTSVDSGLAGFVQNICSWTLSITSSSSSSLTSSSMNGGRRLQSIALLPEGVYACLTMVANHLPILLNVLSQTSATHWLRDALKAYCSLSSCDDVTLREACAYGLSTMCNACTNRHAIEKLSRVCATLTKDNEGRVRIALASTFSQLPPSVANGYMLSTLLGDSDRRVTTALLPTLAVCLKTFLPGNSPSSSASSASLNPSLKHSVSVGGNNNNGGASGGNHGNNNSNTVTGIIDIRVGASLMDFVCTPSWRTRQLIADQLGEAAKIFANGGGRSRDEILLLLRTFFRDCIGAVRKSAGVSILKIIRLIRVSAVRHRELSLFFNEFSHIHISCNIRLSLVDIIYEAAHLFSNQSFRLHGFATRLMALALDDVSNVRLKVAMSLHIVVLACNDMLVQNPSFNEVVHSLAQDEDRDIKLCMLGFDSRAAKISSSRRAARKDSKKLTFERWLYMDQFTCLNVPQQQTSTQQGLSKHDREFHSQPFISVSGRGRKNGSLMPKNKISQGRNSSSSMRRMIIERRGMGSNESSRPEFGDYHDVVDDGDDDGDLVDDDDKSGLLKRTEKIKTGGPSSTLFGSSTTSTTSNSSITGQSPTSATVPATAAFMRKRRHHEPRREAVPENGRWHGLTAALGRMKKMFSPRSSSSAPSTPGTSRVGSTPNTLLCLVGMDEGQQRRASKSRQRRRRRGKLEQQDSGEAQQQRERDEELEDDVLPQQVSFDEWKRLGSRRGGLLNVDDEDDEEEGEDKFSEVDESDMDIVDEPMSLPTEFGSMSDMDLHAGSDVDLNASVQSEPVSMPVDGFVGNTTVESGP